MRFLASGIPHLDAVLGGGIPAGDVLLIVGPPGSGKTTLVFQHAFHAASEDRSVVYVSTLSEPPPRLVGHLRTFSFWNSNLIGKRIFLESIYPMARHEVRTIVDALVETVRANQAQLLVFDGLMTLSDLHPTSIEMRSFVSDLATCLAPLGCTVMLTSSLVPDLRASTPPEFTMADAILELGQGHEVFSVIRTLRAWKVRGAPNLLGDHAFRITRDGLAVFPRVETRPLPAAAPLDSRRLSIGSAELDAMMGGGLPAGGVTIAAGASGTGKSLLALHYLMAGVSRGEKGLLVGFRETPDVLVKKARAFGMDLEAALREGVVQIRRYVPSELIVDEVLTEVWETIEQSGATLLAIDSIAELEAAVPHGSRRRSVMAAITELIRGHGVTAVLTREMSQIIGPELDFADSPLEVLAENVLLMRHVEYAGGLVRIVSVLKMRDSAHDQSIRQYEIREDGGMRVLPQAQTAEGLLTGVARRPSERRAGGDGARAGRGGA